MQRGLGNNSCGGTTALPAFQVPNNQNLTHSFRIIPITSDTDKMAESNLDFDTIFNVIDKVTINGAEMVSFDPVKTDYEMSYLEGSFVGVPLIEVEKTSEDAGTVEIQQAEGRSGHGGDPTATDKYGVTKTYTINFTETTSAYAGDMSWMVSECGWGDTQIDRSIDGNPLKLTVDGQEKTFAKGIGTHATSRIAHSIFPVRAIPASRRWSALTVNSMAMPIPVLSSKFTLMMTAQIQYLRAARCAPQQKQCRWM